MPNRIDVTFELTDGRLTVDTFIVPSSYSKGDCVSSILETYPTSDHLISNIAISCVSRTKANKMMESGGAVSINDYYTGFE